MLINTAGGHLALAHQSDLLERVARGGMVPSTPHSLREVSQLYASVVKPGKRGSPLNPNRVLQVGAARLRCCPAGPASGLLSA